MVNKESMTGVIAWIGNIIIPIQCNSIGYELIYDEEAVWMEDDIAFFCYEEDGSVRAIEKKW